MRPLTWLARLGLVVTAGALLVTGVVVAVAPRIWTVANAHEELPVELPAFQPLAQRSYVYDALGNEIGVFELENSQPIPLASVPQHVKDAFLLVEDKEFYRHDGVNVRSLVRATLSNFASTSPQQGASTITMQVVKNDFLAGLERDGRYKLLQVHYALMLDREYPKDAILERYLNTVFFGNNSYGIQAAAETYFGTTADQLTFIQAAFLAGLVRAPSTYDPINNPERSRARFAQVLERLVDDGALSEAEAATLATDFILPERTLRIPQRQYARTYFTEALRDYLLNRSSLLGKTYEARYSTLFRGGLRIHTTFNPDLQRLAEEARNVLPDTAQGFDASIVSLETSTGAIRAMVGGRGFVPNERETNMALAPRQTGSSIKFFILAAALQAGAQPNDVINGSTPCILPNPQDPTKPFEIKDAAAPRGADLRHMTEASINCAYARLSQIVGLHRVVDTTYRMAQSPYLYPGPAGGRASPHRAPRQLRDGRQRDEPAGHGVGRPDDRQRRPAPRAVLHRHDRRRRRAPPLHPRLRRHAGARPRRGADRHRRAEGRAHPRHRSSLPAQPPGRRQDRDPAGQHQRLVRRLHARADDVGVGRRSGRLHADGERPRVRGRQPRVRPGRSLPDADLAGLHEPGAGVRPVERLGAAAGRRPTPGAALPAGQRVPRPGRRHRRRGARHRAPGRADAARGVPPARAAPPPPPPPETTPGAPPTETTLAPGSDITAPIVTRLVPIPGQTTIPPDVLDPRVPLPSAPLTSPIIRC